MVIIAVLLGRGIMGKIYLSSAWSIQYRLCDVLLHSEIALGGTVLGCIVINLASS